jgi:Zn-dependent protease
MRHGAASIGILLLVLAVHELGHFLAMKALGYVNVTVFFVPLGGAVMTGRGFTMSAAKKALISLAGPVPGIAIGVPVALVAARTGNPLYQDLAVTFFLLNCFNLLPLYPLDGGAVLHQLFFRRSKVAEAVYTVLAGAALVALAFALKAWFVGVVGLLTMISVRLSWKRSEVAARLKGKLDNPPAVALSEAEMEIRLTVIRGVVAEFPTVRSGKQIADSANEVWERLLVQAPRAWTTVGLFLLYLLSLLTGTAVGLVLLAGMNRS